MRNYYKKQLRLVQSAHSHGLKPTVRARLFQQIFADAKGLGDIPKFWRQAQRLRLARVGYTAREVRSGLLFWAFAEKRSAATSAVIAACSQQPGWATRGDQRPIVIVDKRFKHVVLRRSDVDYRGFKSNR